MRSSWILLVIGGVAHAAPVASLASDLDGDKNADKVELDEVGTLAIQTARGSAKVALGIKPQRATVTSAIVRGTPTIVVQTDTEGFAVQASGGTWKTVVRTPLGGVGLDAEYRLALDAGDAGIVKYQTRYGFERCDGKPAYLFPEVFEAGKWQALTKLPIGVAANTSVIAARVDPGAAPAPAIFTARAVSYQAGAPDAGALALPHELDDGSLTTVWHEDLASAGEGQFFTFKARFAAKAAQLRIVPGTNLKGASGPQRLAVVGARGAWRIDLPNPKKDPLHTAYVADLPTPIDGCVTVVIESSYGTMTAIAELEVFAEGERSGDADDQAARHVAQGDDSAQGAARTLAQHGAPAVAALERELTKATDAAARTRLVRALLQIHDPAASGPLAHATTEGWIEGADLIAAIKALAGLGQAHALYDLAVKSAVPLEARVVAIHAFQPGVAKDRELLVMLAGRGPREQRQAVIEMLVNAPLSELVPAAQAAKKPSTAGDLWRAITRRAHAKPDERAQALAAMTAAVASVSDYERRYRLIDGIAALGDAASMRQLQTTLRQLPPGHETSAFKQVAARAIAVNRRPEAFDLAIALVKDADPGVRLAAISALAGAGGGTAGPWHGPSGVDGVDRVLVTSLATDSWPEVRRYAAQVLGLRCSRVGPERALQDSVARDRNVDVRGDALAALVECKARSAGELLAKLWDDPKAPLELRQRAVNLGVQLGDKALGAKLVGKFNRWRREAVESENALALAQAAAYALGSLKAQGATAALVDALDDSAFPEIVGAAAAALGQLGADCPADAKKKLTALSQSDEAQVQAIAAHAAAVCGKPTP